jgi:peptidyl-prolyl cis-trans isomerase B (cyclophilin B)
MKTKVLLGLLIISTLISVGFLTGSCSETEPEPAPTPTPVAGETPSGWVQIPTQVGGEKIMNWNEPPEMMIDTAKQYRAIMETEHGKMVLELFAKDVPKTVNNFVFLATHGYYNDTTFHRVIPGFMAQGGDPTGTGRGGPGYMFADEFTEHSHVAGALSMANAGANTNGSQFFITYTPQHGLDGRHTVFGQLTEGMDILESITPRDPSKNPQFEGDKLLSVRIEVKEGS